MSAPGLLSDGRCGRMPLLDHQVQRVVQQRALIETLVGHGRRVRRDHQECEISLLREQQVEAAVGLGLGDAYRQMGMGGAQSGGSGR